MNKRIFYALIALALPLSARADTLFSTSDVPAAAYNDQPTEVGTVFWPTVNGKVTAIRFYKESGDTGPHTGNLWDYVSQANLGTVTFSNETASGWQQQTLSTPVTLVANHVYVVSYHTTLRYGATSQYFAVQHTSGSLIAPANAENGGNGVYIHGSSSAFPSKTYNGTNYFADLVFNPAGTPIVMDDRAGIGTHFDQGWNVEGNVPVIAPAGFGWIRDNE